VTVVAYDEATLRERQDRYAALDGPALDHAVESLLCPIDGQPLERKPNPRQAKGFGDIFVCSCGFEVTQ
jgi:hypothetical protein